MKTITIKRVILAALVSVVFFPTVMFGQVSHTVSFNLSDFSFGKRDSFDIVRSNGLGFSSEVGAPMLPVENINLIVPPGSDISSVTINGTTKQEVNGKFRIYPGQPPAPTSLEAAQRKFVPTNSAIYNSTAAYPISCVTRCQRLRLLRRCHQYCPFASVSVYL